MKIEKLVRALSELECDDKILVSASIPLQSYSVSLKNLAKVREKRKSIFKSRFIGRYKRINKLSSIFNHFQECF